jgi:hypothetical protein
MKHPFFQLGDYYTELQNKCPMFTRSLRAKRGNLYRIALMRLFAAAHQVLHFVRNDSA